MKRVSVLFVSALTLGMVFTSCNKDDDSSSSSTASIEGKWQHSKEGMIMDGDEMLEDYENECATKKDYIELLSGNVAKEGYYPSDCVLDITEGTWAKNGNNITATFEGEGPMTAEIVTLNATTLKIKFVEEGMTYVAVFTRM